MITTTRTKLLYQKLVANLQSTVSYDLVTAQAPKKKALTELAKNAVMHEHSAQQYSILVRTDKRKHHTQ
jgi:hypothetical protein